jgi:hypothetical protein
MVPSLTPRTSAEVRSSRPFREMLLRSMFVGPSQKGRVKILNAAGEEEEG